MEKSKRIEWIDTLRFIGMFSIYLSHLYEQAGYFYPFGYRFQTPLFFFIAGAADNLARVDSTFLQHLKKKFTGIMLPYFFFGLVSILIICITGTANAGEILKTVLQYLLGIRNQLFAPMLWFLPCIFVMSLLFYGLKKLVRNSWLLLVVAMGLLVISETLLPHRPIENPSWFWNVDSVLYYFFYFVLGYVVFPYVRQLVDSRSVWAYIGKIVSAAIVTAYAFFLLVGKDPIAILLGRIPNSDSIIVVSSAVVMIWFSIMLAQILSFFPLLPKIGRNTLWLCGSEQVIRHITPPLFSILGWSLTFSSPASAVIFTFGAILAAEFAIIPVLKTLYHSLFAFFNPSWLQPKLVEQQAQAYDGPIGENPNQP